MPLLLVDLDNTLIDRAGDECHRVGDRRSDDQVVVGLIGHRKRDVGFGAGSPDLEGGLAC